MKKGHIAIRTCIGCRQRRPAREMIRLKALGDTVVVSTRRDNLPGRGCYSCPRDACLEKALNKGPLSRALRKNIAVYPSREGLHRGFETKGVPG